MENKYEKFGELSDKEIEPGVVLREVDGKSLIIIMSPVFYKPDIDFYSKFGFHSSKNCAWIKYIKIIFKNNKPIIISTGSDCFEAPRYIFKNNEVVYDQSKQIIAIKRAINRKH